MQNQTQTARDDAVEVENGEKPTPQYFIDVDGADEQHRSLKLLIASRRCYICQQEDEEEVSPSAKPEQFINRIGEHCSSTSDYLLPDTPLKEAIFRVLLSEGNRLMTAAEIGGILSQKWAMTPFPRDTSPRVIQRLLDHIESYCIARLPEPEESIE